MEYIRDERHTPIFYSSCASFSSFPNSVGSILLASTVNFHSLPMGPELGFFLFMPVRKYGAWVSRYRHEVLASRGHAAILTRNTLSSRF